MQVYVADQVLEFLSKQFNVRIEDPDGGVSPKFIPDWWTMSAMYGRGWRTLEVVYKWAGGSTHTPMSPLLI